MAERQLKFEQKLLEGEKRQKKNELARRLEQRNQRDAKEEKSVEAREKRMRVKKDLISKDNKAFEEYKRDVKQKREEAKAKWVMEQNLVAERARAELRKASQKREQTLQML